jgi:hypothetical protein
MAGFATEEDLYRYIGGIFQTALTMPEIGDALRATGLVLRVLTTDPAGELTIDLANANIGLGDLGLTPDATMRMSSEDANLFWQGEVNLPLAMARKRIVVEGKMSSLLKLVPQTKPLFATYIELLQRDGRTDLLARA